VIQEEMAKKLKKDHLIKDLKLIASLKMLGKGKCFQFLRVNILKLEWPVKMLI